MKRSVRRKGLRDVSPLVDSASDLTFVKSIFYQVGSAALNVVFGRQDTRTDDSRLRILAAGDQTRVFVEQSSKTVPVTLLSSVSGYDFVDGFHDRIDGCDIVRISFFSSLSHGVCCDRDNDGEQ